MRYTEAEIENRWQQWLDKHGLTFTKFSAEVTEQTGATGIIESHVLLTAEQMEALQKELDSIMKGADDGICVSSHFRTGDYCSVNQPWHLARKLYGKKVIPFQLREQQEHDKDAAIEHYE